MVAGTNLCHKDSTTLNLTTNNILLNLKGKKRKLKFPFCYVTNNTPSKRNELLLVLF